MTEDEAYKVHIQYTFNAFCKIVIRHAAIDKILKLRRRWEREVSLDYLMNEKFVQLAELEQLEEYLFAACGQSGGSFDFGQMPDGDFDFSQIPEEGFDLEELTDMGEGGFSFGGFESSQDATSLVNSPIDTPVSMGSVESRPMLSWIFSDESYTETYHQYFSEFIETVFASGAFAEWIAETQALIAPYVEKDPTKFCTTEEFEAGVDALVEFCTLRAESIQGQLEGSIPATQEGQQAEDDALIDASGLDLGAMGSMDMGGMGGGGFGPGNGDMPEGMPEDMPETE